MSKFTPKSTFMMFGVAAAMVASAPVVAQAIAYVDRTIAIVNTAAFKSGWQQINQIYGQNIQSMAQKEQEIATLVAPLDTNKDGDFSDQELAAAPKPTVDRINVLNGEMQQLQAPIIIARIYVLEQINTQYDLAQAAVVKAKKVNIILRREALVYGAESADLTQSIVAEIDAKLPQAAIAAPEGWQPQRRSLQLYQEVEEILQVDAMLRQQQAQQGGAATAAPAQQPAADQGR